MAVGVVVRGWLLLFTLLYGGSMQCNFRLSEVTFDNWESREQRVMERIGRKKIEGSCVRLFLRRGLYSTVQQLIRSGQLGLAEGGLEAMIREESSWQRQALEGLMTQSLQGTPVIQLSPAFKWGQGFGEVILLVKYSHRIDTPGLANAKTLRSEVANNTLVHEVSGSLSGRRITYRLILPLFASVKEKSLEVTQSGVGTVTIRLRKRKYQVWQQLVAQDADSTQLNYSLWLDLPPNYEVAMKEYFQLVNKSNS